MTFAQAGSTALYRSLSVLIGFQDLTVAATKHVFTILVANPVTPVRTYQIPHFSGIQAASRIRDRSAPSVTAL